MKTIKKDVNNSILLLIDDVNKLYFFRVEDINYEKPGRSGLWHSGENYKDSAMKDYLNGKLDKLQEYHQRVALHLVKYASTIRQVTVEDNLNPDIKIARAHTKPARRQMGKLLQALGYKNMGSNPIEIPKIKIA